MSEKNGKKQKKKSKRTKKTNKLWGLEKNTFPFYAREYMDQDYVHQLNDEEKAWLSQFNEEYYGNAIPKRGALHKGKKKRRELYSQTNARNRDIYFKALKSGADSLGTVSEESSVVDYMDTKRALYTKDDE